VLLDEVMAKAHAAADPAKDLPVDSPFQKVVRTWGEAPSPSEATVSDALQPHEPPTIVQPPEVSTAISPTTSAPTSQKYGPTVNPEVSPELTAATSHKDIPKISGMNSAVIRT
jgi:hypothetical protein